MVRCRGSSSVAARAGWRLAGSLPGVDGGLAEAGSVQVGTTLWLFGGRTASGPSSDVWRVDLSTGAAENVAPAGPAPPPRISPALAYDVARNRILAFGGTDAAGGPNTDLWAFDLRSMTWTAVAGPCSGSGCPVVTGRESLSYEAARDLPTVIADRAGPGGNDVGWTLAEGVWETLVERALGPGRADCDGDGVPEDRAGLRCDAGTDGYPAHGRLRCDGERLACRQPVKPGVLLWEYPMRRLRALAVHGNELLALKGTTVDAYPLGPDGALGTGRSIRLRRAAHDIAVSGEALLATEGRELALYDLREGRRLSSVPTCGKARRVFADGSRAFVTGVRSLLVVDVSDPASPEVLSRLRLTPLDDRMVAEEVGDCRRFWDTLDRVCDESGACGAFGRGVAAYEEGRLFLNMLGRVYVLDFRTWPAPSAAQVVRCGLLRDMRAELPFLYGNGPFGGTIVLVEGEDGAWRRAGVHDVPDWVEGTVHVGGYAVWAGPGTLRIATRQ